VAGFLRESEQTIFFSSFSLTARSPVLFIMQGLAEIAVVGANADAGSLSWFGNYGTVDGR
jgi:hypothetical protein